MSVEMRQPRCPKCQGLLVLEPAVAGLPERVLCRACGWQLYREAVPAVAEIPPLPAQEKRNASRVIGTCCTCGRDNLVLISQGGDCSTCYKRIKAGLDPLAPRSRGRKKLVQPPPKDPNPEVALAILADDESDYISNGIQNDADPSHENTIQGDAAAPETVAASVVQLTPPLNETPPHETDSGPSEPICDLAPELAERILSRVHELMKPKSKRRQLWEQRNRIRATTSCTCGLTTTPWPSCRAA